MQKKESRKREQREGAQTSVQRKALEAAVETLPARSGRQDTHHQVLQHFVIVSHAVSSLWTFPPNYNFSGEAKLFAPLRTSPDIDPRTPPPRSAVSQTTFLPNRPPLRKFILRTIRRSEAMPNMEDSGGARATHSRTLHPQLTVPLGARERRDAN